MDKKALLLLVFFLFLKSLLGQKDLPFALVENKGQWPSHVLFASDVQGGKVFFETDRLTYHLFDLSAIIEAHNEGKVFDGDDVRIKGHVYHVQFVGANENAVAMTDQPQQAYYNYFLGNDSTQWAGGCRAYARVNRKALYHGIDIDFYTTGHVLKYDFIVKPHADVAQIKLRYVDTDRLELENGRLKIVTAVGVVYEQRPLAWQFINGEKRMVDCRYQLRNDELSFVFPKGYDHRFELVIDPELVFSTYSGSYANNFGYTATYDLDGNLYAGGSTFGQGYPTTSGAYQITFNGGHSTLGGIDMGLTKYHASGTSLIWSTYLGGNGDDLPHSIVVNDQGELFVYGTTGSNTYPVTSGAIDVSFNGGTWASSSGTGANFVNGSDIVVTRFNQACTQLIASTYIGGSANDGLNLASALRYNYADEFRGEITLDAQGNPIIVSSTLSSDFPVYNAFQSSLAGQQDGVVMKLYPDLSGFFWCSYIGGSGNDSGFSVAENSNGEVYICGGTTSTDFLQQNNVLQPSYGGGTADGFIVRLSSNGQSIASCTYWGSDAYDQVYFIEIDGNEMVYVFGQTRASGSQMIINANYGTPGSGNLLSKFNTDLSQVIWSTVFGPATNKPTLSPSAFLVDYCNRVYISGWGITQVAGNALNPNQNLSSMASMPVTPEAYDGTCNSGDFYMAVFDENMNALEYATFFGGNQSSEHVDGGTSRFDRKGVIYQSACAGCGGFDDFPAYPANVWSAQNNNNCNNGVFKFDFQLPLTIADFDYIPVACANSPIQFQSTASYAEAYEWNFGDGQTSNVANPIHQYDEVGTYTIRLVVSSSNTCNGVDTVYKTIQIQQPVSATLNELHACSGDVIQLGLPSSNPNYQYVWSPTQYLNNPNIPNPSFEAGTTTTYTLSVDSGGCVDTYYQTVQVTQLYLQVPSDTTLCDEEELVLAAIIQPASASIIWSDEISFGNVLNDHSSDLDIVVAPSVPTTYYVQISENGCTLTDEVFVNLVSFQTVIQGDFTACVGDTVDLFVQDPNPDFVYEWLPDELVASGQGTSQVEVVVQEPTLFTIISHTPDGCTANDSVFISVSLLNEADVVATAEPAYIVNGQTSQLNVLPEGYSYQWSPGATLNSAVIRNPIASPTTTTTYNVIIRDGECVATKSLTVYVTDFECGRPTVYVPNTFTPNADNKNDLFYVRANQLSELYFVIYDRWGEKVFETTSLEIGWDGTFRGRPLDPDVYVYYLNITCVGGEEYQEQGNITLIR